MKSLLIKQAVVIPLGAMLVPILMAFFLPGYSSVSQHISEVAMLDHPIALVQRSAAFVTGVSILLFGLGAFLVAPRNFVFTALAAVAFGAAMISNGVFVMGSPLHGLHGLGLFLVMVPAFFAAEVEPTEHNRKLRKLSLFVAVFNMAYMLLMFSGFDHAAFRGLTQRVATVTIFGWYSVASYWLAYRATVPSTTHRAAFKANAVAG